jgi:diaminohydroxyphosphoribosylaminopyrimidine deaminase/5-amino-6-(5-phosphoribosylamino)uracil reductase
VFGKEGAGPARQAILEGAGARVEQIAAVDGGVELGAVLQRLGELGVRRALVEGGGRLAAALMQADLVDRLEWFRAPVALGNDARPGVHDLHLQRLAEAPKWKRVALRELGPDLWESYERA